MIGDFEILERVDKEHYKVRCIHCGVIKTFSDTTVKYGKMQCRCKRLRVKKCINCGKEFETERNARFCGQACTSAFFHKHPQAALGGKKKQNKGRKVTETTKKLICIYTAEGESIEEIAKVLHREEGLVKRILDECRKNGKYDFYIENCPILQNRGMIKRNAT